MSIFFCALILLLVSTGQEVRGDCRGSTRLCCLHSSCTMTPECASSEPECPLQACTRPGIFSLSDSCSRYYVCLHSEVSAGRFETLVRRCPPAHEFSTLECRCVPSSGANCSLTPESTPPGVTGVTPQGTTEVKPETTTPACVPSSRQPDPSHCGRYFVCDSSGELSVRMCIGTLLYDVNKLRCVIQADCGGRFNPHAPNITTPTPTTTTERPLLCVAATNARSIVRLGGTRYLFGNQAVTWPEARQLCQDCGMDLASIETREENDLIMQHLTQIGFRDGRMVWTGGNKLGDGRTWRWAHGGEVLNFTAWERGQPSHPGSSHCLALYTGGWHDDECPRTSYLSAWSSAFLCEDLTQ